HRDLKPDNIMVSRQGYIKVLDFGISTAPTESDMQFQLGESGSMYYMSPEQVNGEEYTSRSDIYQLGLILFQCLTGRLPFDKCLWASASYRKRGDLLPTNEVLGDAAIAESMRKFLESCLSRDAAERPATMVEFSEKLLDAYTMM